MSQRPFDPFDGFPKPEAKKVNVWTDVALGAAPPSRKDLEEAQTQKPFDARQSLDELLEVATSAHYVMADAIVALDRLIAPHAAEALRSWRTKLQEKCEEIRSSCGPKVHVLKADPAPFREVWAGIKAYEIRKFDRDFRVGDELKLVEFDRAEARYSGAKIRAKVTTLSKPGEWGLPPGVGVLGIAVLEKAEA